MNISELLTIEKFEAWLRKHKMDEVIGESMSCFTCPIAVYLQSAEEKFGQVSVTGSNVHCLEGINIVAHALPEWAVEFVNNLDNLGRNYTEVGTALQVLRGCGKNHHVYNKQGSCIYCHKTHRLDFKQNEICSFKRA